MSSISQQTYILVSYMVIGLSCNSKIEVSNTEGTIKRIDSIVLIFDNKFKALNGDQLISEQKFDSTLIREPYSSFICYKDIDPQISCIEFDDQKLLYQSERYYYLNDTLVLAVFSKEENFEIKEYGRQYFQNDSLIYTKFSSELADKQRTLNKADSLKKECDTKIGDTKSY